MWKNISISNSWISAREAIFFLALSGNFIITICTLFYSLCWKKIKNGLILAIFGAVRQLPLIHTFFRILETCGTTNPFAISGRISGNGSWQEAAKKWQQEKLSW